MAPPVTQDFLRALFKAATDAALPDVCIAHNLPDKPKGRTVVIGAGKAAASMARAVEKHWAEQGKGALEGLVVTRYGHAVETRNIEVLEAAHPLPDQAGVEASRRILRAVEGLSADDLVLCLVSGGGSALLSLPATGISLDDKIALTDQLLRSGATISEMNAVRKHLSAIKGGRLAVACHPARVVALIISDVPGDDLSSIASGVTVADPTTYGDARAVIERYGLSVPAAIAQMLAAGGDETPKPGDARFSRVENRLIATPQMSLQAAARAAEAAGYRAVIISDRIEGEARDVAEQHAALARQAAKEVAEKGPVVLLSGGETTVTVQGKGGRKCGRKCGRGGRNAEFLLALALALDGQAGIHAIACDTDGIDGTEDNAGAVIGPDTLKRAASINVDARACLDRHDAYGFFAALNDLVMTGPTLTNVNDFRAMVIEA